MFKGLGQLGDMAKMMKAAKEMQGRMGELQEELARTHLEGEAGFGLVKVKITGKGDITGLSIDPRILVASEQAQTEALILQAVQNAQARAQSHAAAEMARLAQSLGLPADMSLPL